MACSSSIGPYGLPTMHCCLDYKTVSLVIFIFPSTYSTLSLFKYHVRWGRRRSWFCTASYPLLFSTILVPSLLIFCSVVVVLPSICLGFPGMLVVACLCFFFPQSSLLSSDQRNIELSTLNCDMKNREFFPMNKSCFFSIPTVFYLSTCPPSIQYTICVTHTCFLPSLFPALHSLLFLSFACCSQNTWWWYFC